jgi:signal transduction histidine kinase
LTTQILDALPVAVIQVTPDGLVRYSNARAVSLLDTARPGAEVGAVLAPLAKLDAATATSHSRATVALGERTFGFQSVTMEDGSRVVAFQDITRVEELRLERDRLLQLASLSDVMPAVLHELKNPLAGISAALELLIEDDSEHQERLHAILVEVRRLGLTIDGLGRFRHEVRSQRFVAVDLALREAFQLLEPQARSRGIETSFDVKDMPLLPFEAAAVRAVVFNLVTNSIYACKAQQRIELKAWFERDTSTLHLEVHDTGTGMPADVLKRCTELFFTTKPRGSGIGLALCKGVADAVGGALHVTSTPGSGTSVAMTLPITKAS